MSNTAETAKSKIEAGSSKLKKWGWTAAGIAAVVVAIALSVYGWSQHHLVVGANDILVSSGCSQDGTNLVIHPDGSGYALQGSMSCLGGNSKAGTRQNYRKRTFDYSSLQKTLAAAQNARPASCAVSQSYLQVQYKGYTNADLMCYGTGSTNDPSSDPDTQKLNNLSDQILVAQSKANL